MGTRATALWIGQRPHELQRSGSWPNAPITGATPVEAMTLKRGQRRVST